MRILKQLKLSLIWRVYSVTSKIEPPEQLTRLIVVAVTLCLCATLLVFAYRSSAKTEELANSANGNAPKSITLTSATTPANDVNVRPVLPHVVTNPNAGRPAFDEFSWESFIALNWPAKIGTDGRPLRGVADTNKTVGDEGPRVWESWKADYELFQDEGAPPSDWSSYNVFNPPCGISKPGSTVPLTVKILPLLAKGGSVLPGGVNQAMGGPLIDQHGKPVRYEIHLNQAYYDFVKSRQFYLQKNLPEYPNPPVNFPMSSASDYGVVEIKAAWREMTPAELNDPAITSRYYISDAVVVMPNSHPPQCYETKLGLVGLHIAHKSGPFKEWIWSTFEQEDSVPEYIYQDPQPNPTPPPPPGGYSFYDITKPAPPKSSGYFPLSARNPLDPTKPLPTRPTQVARVNPIATLTQQMNAKVRVMDKIKNTVWAHYKLIETQWPTNVTSPVVINNPNTGEDHYPLGCGNPTPPSGVDPPPPPPEPGDRVANLTMESYFQVKNPNFTNRQPGPYQGVNIFGSSCMHCHYQAAQTDFSWVLPDMAWDPNSGSRNPSFGVASATQRKMVRSPTLRPTAPLPTRKGRRTP